MVSSSGGLARVVDKARTWLWKEMERARRNLDRYEKQEEERKKKKEEEDIRSGAAADLAAKRRQLEKDKIEMMRKLQALGMTTAGVKKVVVEEEDEEGKTRLGTVRKMRREYFESHRLLFDAYRNLSKVVTGPHSFCVASGRYRLYAHIEGVDVFDILPNPTEE